MKEKLLLELELELCDRNRNFGEITESIYEAIKQRDGVDGFIIIKSDFAKSEASE